MSLSHSIACTIKRFGGILALGIMLPFASAQLVAETVAIPLGQQGKAWNVETPRTGLSKEQVEARYGAPQSQSGPVGDPPIYTWDYGQFLVYFEGSHVIHSVVKYPTKDQ